MLLLTLALADDAALERYAAEHLERVETGHEAPSDEDPTVVFSATSASYLIVDGQGERLLTPEVLLRAGYAEQAAIVAREARRRRVTALLLAGAGAATWGAGVVLVELEPLDTPLQVRTGATMAGTGLLVGALYPTFQRRALVHPDAVWTPEEADRFVDEANARLRQELGLDPLAGEPSKESTGDGGGH